MLIQNILCVVQHVFIFLFEAVIQDDVFVGATQDIWPRK